MKFIFTADWHLRGDKPRCRLDEDWVETQRKAVRFVVEQANLRSLPIFIGGDIFHTPRVSTEVLNMVIVELKKCKEGVYILAGNHDLPYHNYDLLHTSSIGVLAECFAELNKVITNGDINARPFGLDDGDNWAKLAISHQLVFPNEKSRPMGCKELGRIPEEVLEQFPHADFVCVGDYHHKFFYVSDSGRCVLNPGCLIRQVADMKDYQCSIAVVDTEARTVEWIDVPDDYALVTDEYLREEEAKQDSISAFVEAIRGGRSVNLDFRANLDARLMEAPADVRTCIQNLMQKTFNESK